ncbi:MAG TPA: SIMPL domain-containing protein [Vicinamibacterales bacterium]|nr:SIMPL domain-containing protein [Vicinamibacterales bacterium]
MRLAILLFLLWLVPSSSGAQQTPQVPTEPVVVVVGEGLVLAVPDRAWITIGAESRAPSPREAQRRNTELMKPVQDKLRAAGIPADAIRTTGYDVQYEWDFVNGKRVGRGYVARNSIEVRIDSIDRVGELLEVAVGSGATSLNGIRFDMKDQAKLEREALRMAVADARQKAEAAAAGAGRTIDRILRIDEQGGVAPPVPVRFMRAEAQAAAADAAPPIAAGQMEIRARVSVTAALK